MERKDKKAVRVSFSGKKIPGGYNPESMEALENVSSNSGSGIEDAFFISRKRSKGSFVLVRLLSSSSMSIIHYEAVEGQVLQMEIKFIRNSFEVGLLQRTGRLCSEGLYVDLEPVSLADYRRFERITQGILMEVLIRGKGNYCDI